MSSNIVYLSQAQSSAKVAARAHISMFEVNCGWRDASNMSSEIICLEAHVTTKEAQCLLAAISKLPATPASIGNVFAFPSGKPMQPFHPHGEIYPLKGKPGKVGLDALLLRAHLEFLLEAVPGLVEGSLYPEQSAFG